MISEGTIVRHRLSGHAGIVRHVSERRTRWPYLVEFAGGATGTFTDYDLEVLPSFVTCPTCSIVCQTNNDGRAECAPCRARWKVG
jgi:hypothetical protein